MSPACTHRPPAVADDRGEVARRQQHRHARSVSNTAASTNNERRGQLAMTTPSHYSEHGNCRGMDPNLFVFQEPRSHLLDAKVIAAKAVCADCPVRAECLADAMTFDAVGVWGCTTQDERRRSTRHLAVVA